MSRLALRLQHLLSGTSKTPPFPRRRESRSLKSLGPRPRGDDELKVCRGTLSRFFLLATLPALLLAGCAHSLDQAVPIGRLHLNAPLPIPAGAASARIQYGRTVAFNAVQEQDPFCVFQIDTVADSPRTLAPASFAVTGIERSVSTFAGLPVMPARSLRVSFGSDDLPTHIYYKTRFRLAADPASASVNAPTRALDLICMSNQQMPGVAIMRHLTRAEIRGALGSLFTLELHAPR
jgi:hypothetical protein